MIRFHGRAFRNGEGPGLPEQWDSDRWPEATERLAAVFRTRTRDEWCARFDGSDACVAPVLIMSEAPMHPHNVHCGTFTEVGGVRVCSPAPVYDVTA